MVQTHRIFSLVLGLVVLGAFHANAATATVNGIQWTYTVSDDVAEIGGGANLSPAVPTSTSDAITIPSSLGGYPVTKIGAGAFKGCTGLTSVTIPSSVTYIGCLAFEGCTGLTSITIPNSVTQIDYQAFYDCSGLTSVMIPASVTKIWGNPFPGCGNLTSIAVAANNSYYCSKNGLLLSKDGKNLIRGINGNVTIPHGVTSLEDQAFEGCGGLTSVTIPNSVTSIGWYAFSGCSGLKSVTIPNSVTSIGRYAFWHCSGLTSVTIPDSVTSIGNEAFRDCNTSLYDTTSIPGVKLVAGWAVAGDSSLSGDLDLTGIRGVGGGAFFGCGGLTSVTIPNSVTGIGDCAFYGCGNLKSVTIPNSVTSIGQDAFEYCNQSLYDTTTIPGVTLVAGWVVAGTSSLSGNLDLTGVRGIGCFAFSGCSGLTSVTIPNSVTSIGHSAFYGCSGLKSMTIPDSVKSIEACAFDECRNLTRLYIPKRFKGNTAQMGIPSSCKITYTFTKYEVAFNANGGKLPKGKKMAAQTMTYGKAAKLRKNVFARKGWVFTGWATSKAKAKKGKISYKNKQSVKNLTKTGDMVTLYAVWAKKTYKVAFYANGGKGQMTVEKFTYGKAKKLSANKFKRNGYTFKGWAKSAANAKKGKVVYKNRQTVKNLVYNGKTVKLYAVWKKK